MSFQPDPNPVAAPLDPNHSGMVLACRTSDNCDGILCVSKSSAGAIESVSFFGFDGSTSTGVSLTGFTQCKTSEPKEVCLTINNLIAGGPPVGTEVIAVMAENQLLGWWVLESGQPGYFQSVKAGDIPATAIADSGATVCTQSPGEYESITDWGCFREAGDIAGRVGVCKSVDDLGNTSIRMIAIRFDGTIIDPYTDEWELCEDVVPCDPMLASYKGDAIPGAVPEFNSFSIIKPQCCVVTVTTDAGVFELGGNIKEFCPQPFECNLTTLSITAVDNAGSDCSADVCVFIQRTK